MFAKITVSRSLAERRKRGSGNIKEIVEVFIFFIIKVHAY